MSVSSKKIQSGDEIGVGIAWGIIIGILFGAVIGLIKNKLK